jgi:hypothetical protein
MIHASVSVVYGMSCQRQVFTSANNELRLDETPPLISLYHTRLDLVALHSFTSRVVVFNAILGVVQAISRTMLKEAEYEEASAPTSLGNNLGTLDSSCY